MILFTICVTATYDIIFDVNYVHGRCIHQFFGCVLYIRLPSVFSLKPSREPTLCSLVVSTQTVDFNSNCKVFLWILTKNLPTSQFDLNIIRYIYQLVTFGG